MASATDNFNLPLYDTGDPANLRDQYNRAMGIVDSELKKSVDNTATALNTANDAKNKAEAAQSTADASTNTANDAIGRLNALGITDDDTAGESKTRWDGASALASINKDDIASIDANLNALHAGTVADADKAYRSNAMDISKIGCIPNDDTVDNAPIINSFIENNPHHAIYIPGGDWYVKSTVLTKDTDVYSDGFIKVGPHGSFTDNTVVSAVGSTETESSNKMPKGKCLDIKIDGSGRNVDGLSVQGFFGSDITACVIECMNVAVKTIKRNVECRFKLSLYGGLDNQYANTGFQIDHRDNDNYAYVIARNFNIGIDLNASIWNFEYVHVWGCNNVMKLYSGTRNYVKYLYTDYTYNGALVCDPSDTTSAVLNCEDIFSIFETNGQYLIGDNDGKHAYVAVNAHTYNANIVHNSIGANNYSTLISPNVSKVFKIQSNIDIIGGVYSWVLIPSDDLNAMNVHDLIAKYGNIALCENITPIRFQPYEDWRDWESFKETKYYQNMIELGYTLDSSYTGTSGYFYGRTSMKIGKNFYQRGDISAATDTVEITIGNNIKGYYAKGTGKALIYETRP